MLDHVYALHVAGVRSGQPNLIEQLGNFQNACRDAARRVGLVPHVPAAGSPFDPDLQQLADPDAPAPVPALIDQTLACGYTVQGQWVRKPLVAVAAPRLADADGGGTSPSGAGARA
jgi:molecular chaperone GrpE (heat shock protein)